MMQFCLATNNKHKVEELQLLLGQTFQIITLDTIGCTEEIEETETTLEGNSRLKARYISDKYKVSTIADDSGLEVEALNGEPGVYSARYAGEHGNHEKNMAKLLENLKNQTNRTAQFRTSITLILDGEVHQFEGIVKGKIIYEKRGTMGFGYDPIFVPDGFEKTFAEMTTEEKNPISHRGKAIEKLLTFLTKK
jgi:XTP/dITP diphosphohydrolase